MITYIRIMNIYNYLKLWMKVQRHYGVVYIGYKLKTDNKPGYKKVKAILNSKDNK